MRTFARLLPAGLALLLLAAHFVRAGRPAGAAAAIGCAALLFVPRSWAVRAVQFALLAGVGIWLRTAWLFADERRALGAPSARLWAILGGVAAFTALAAWMLEPRARALGTASGHPSRSPSGAGD